MKHVLALLGALYLFDQPNLTAGARPLTTRQLTTIRLCDQFPGTNAGAKLAACIADLPAVGGVADARSISGAQAWSICPLTGVTKPVDLLLGVGVITVSAACTVPTNVNIVFQPGATISGTGITFSNSVVHAEWFAGVDIGARINQAYAALPATGGRIHLASAVSCQTFSTPITFDTISKAVILSGEAPSGNTNTSSQGGVCLNYAPAAATPAITIDWVSATENGFFGAGAGLRDIALVNGGSCETQGGCRSSAIGVKIGGSHGGMTAGRFENVKIQGFGTGVYVPDSRSVTFWGNVFDNVTFKSNTIGLQVDNASEEILFTGGAFVNGGQAFKSTASVIAKFISTHFDGNTGNKVIEDNGSGSLQFISPHFENLNVGGPYPKGVADSNHHYIYANSNVVIMGGTALDDNASGNSDYWFLANSSLVIQGLAVSSAGATTTNLSVFGAGSLNIVNSSPAVLKTVCPKYALASNCAEITDQLHTAYFNTPKLGLGTAGGALNLVAAAAAEGNVITFPPVSGQVLTTANDIHVNRLRGQNAGGTCPTAPIIGAQCTSQILNWPVVMPDTNYVATCSITGPVNAGTIAYITKGTTGLTVTIMAGTNAPADFTSIDCIGMH